MGPIGSDFTCEYRETLLEVKGLSYAYNGEPVLRDLSLEIKNLVRPGYQQGQVVALLGPSGVGKTTLFRLIAGLESPQEGVIRGGKDLRPIRRGTVGVVAQHYPLFSHRTVLGNLLVAGGQAGLRGHKARDKAGELLMRFGLGELGQQYPAQLSGGQRQRAAIAQQFMCSDNFLLMDEPFSGLDVLAQEAVIQFIHEMASHDELMTFILITHDISAALQVADTVMVMGRERDDTGEVVPGARVRAEFNLVERNLAWRPDIASLPEFQELRQEIRELFPEL